MIGLVAIKDYGTGSRRCSAVRADGALALDGGALDRLFEGATAVRGAVEPACGPARETPDLAGASGLSALLEQQAPAARPAAGKAEAAAAAADGCRRGCSKSRSSMVRVDFAKLDHLLNLVGELIVNRTKLARAGAPARRRGARAPGPHLARGGAPGRRRLVPAPGDDHGRADAADPPRLRALPAPRARPARASRARRSSWSPAGRGHARRQGRDRRARRAARAPDPQRVDHGIEPPAPRRARGKTRDRHAAARPRRRSRTRSSSR